MHSDNTLDFKVMCCDEYTSVVFSHWFPEFTRFHAFDRTRFNDPNVFSDKFWSSFLKTVYPDIAIITTAYIDFGLQTYLERLPYFAPPPYASRYR